MKNYVATLTMAFAFALPLAVHAQTLTPPPVPPGIEVDPPHRVFLVGHATGTQNYVCQPADPLGRVAWTLFTPQATLFGDLNEQLTTHFFGPNPEEPGIVRAAWQDSRDTSTVWARAVASSVDANFVSPGAIPWVKLVKAGTAKGPTGGGTLAATTFVQRLNTEGGIAPTTGCDQLNDVGRKAFMPYTADYFFYKEN